MTAPAVDMLDRHEAERALAFLAEVSTDPWHVLGCAWPKELRMVLAWIRPIVAERIASGEHDPDVPDEPLTGAELAKFSAFLAEMFAEKAL